MGTCHSLCDKLKIRLAIQFNLSGKCQVVQIVTSSWGDCTWRKLLSRSPSIDKFGHAIDCTNSMNENKKCLNNVLWHKNYVIEFPVPNRLSFSALAWLTDRLTNWQSTCFHCRCFCSGSSHLLTYFLFPTQSHPRQGNSTEVKWTWRGSRNRNRSQSWR